MLKTRIALNLRVSSNIYSLQVHPRMTVRQMNELFLNCSLFCKGKSASRTIISDSGDLIVDYLLTKSEILLEDIMAASSSTTPQITLKIMESVQTQMDNEYHSLFIQSESNKVIKAIVRNPSNLQLYESIEILKTSIKSYSDYEQILKLRKIILKLEENSNIALYQCREGQKSFHFFFKYTPKVSLLNFIQQSQCKIKEIYIKVILLLEDLLGMKVLKLDDLQTRKQIDTFLAFLSLDINGNVSFELIDYLFYQQAKNQGKIKENSDLKAISSCIYETLATKSLKEGPQAQIKFTQSIQRDSMFMKCFKLKQMKVCVSKIQDQRFTPISDHFYWKKIQQSPQTQRRNQIIHQMSTIKKSKKKMRPSKPKILQFSSIKQSKRSKTKSKHNKMRINLSDLML